MKDIGAESVAVSITIPQYIMFMEFIYSGFITFLFYQIRFGFCSFFHARRLLARVKI
jgi:hypothetical protein